MLATLRHPLCGADRGRWPPTRRTGRRIGLLAGETIDLSRWRSPAAASMPMPLPGQRHSRASFAKGFTADHRACKCASGAGSMRSVMSLEGNARRRHHARHLQLGAADGIDPVSPAGQARLSGRSASSATSATTVASASCARRCGVHDIEGLKARGRLAFGATAGRHIRQQRRRDAAQSVRPRSARSWNGYAGSAREAAGARTRRDRWRLRRRRIAAVRLAVRRQDRRDACGSRPSGRRASIRRCRSVAPCCAAIRTGAPTISWSPRSVSAGCSSPPARAPPARLAALRKAFDRMMEDPLFVADAVWKMNLERGAGQAATRSNATSPRIIRQPHAISWRAPGPGGRVRETRGIEVPRLEKRA